MNPLYILLVVAIIWFVAMALLFSPKNMYSNAFDRMTRGHYRKDKAQLQMLLDHLRSFPNEWSVSNTSASFPKEGAKQYYLNHDEKTGWSYTLASFESRPRELAGHYGAEISKQLTHENNRREVESMMRQFYPELNGQVLLK